jgi:RHS repeat-associated protein
VLAVAQKPTPSPYVYLPDTHPACTPANDHRYPYAHRLAYARAPGSTFYEEFHPFGTTSYAANDSGIEVSAKRYRYIGKERDEETGVYQFGARYLAAWLGRWTAADPSGLADGPNRYVYAGNRPIGSRDSTGNAEEDALRELELVQARMILQIAEPGGATPERLNELESITSEIVAEQRSLSNRKAQDRET